MKTPGNARRFRIRIHVGWASAHHDAQRGL